MPDHAPPPPLSMRLASIRALAPASLSAFVDSIGSPPRDALLVASMHLLAEELPEWVDPRRVTCPTCWARATRPPAGGGRW